MSECTFKPTINNKIKVESSLNPKENLMSAIQKEQQKRKQKEEEIKKQSEYTDFNECTFKPEVNKGIKAKTNEIVEIKGLGRHIELVEKKKLLEKEKKEREEQVFWLKNKIKFQSNENGNYTIPEPFTLSKPKLGDIEKRKEEIIREQMAEYTFQPSINEKNKFGIREYEVINQS